MEQVLLVKEQNVDVKEQQLAQERQALEAWQQSLSTSLKTDLIKNVLLRQDVLSLCNYKPDESADEIVRQINSLLLTPEWESMNALLSTNYDALYSNLQKDFLMLDRKELKLVFLTCTQIFDKRELPEILGIYKKEYDIALKLAKEKLLGAGWSLEQIVREYTAKEQTK